jgi:hypothetical protein
MGGRELLKQKSIDRTALLKMSSELSRCVRFKALVEKGSATYCCLAAPSPGTNSRKFELKPPANRPNDPNFS